jgi:hypothetical protein
MSNNIERLRLLFKKIGYGEIRIKIENGEPVCLPAQVIEKGIGKITEIKVINKSIDLTKDDSNE